MDSASSKGSFGPAPHFLAWWNRSHLGRPLMHVMARRDKSLEGLEPVAEPRTPEELHLDVSAKSAGQRNLLRTHLYLADAFPNLSVNIGPGSLATYLGSEPTFAWDTVWFQENVSDWRDAPPLAFDPANPWWTRHLALVREAQVEAAGRYLVDIPDLVEGVDILSAMRGPQPFCMDLIDEPEEIERRLAELDRVYFEYYDPLYEAVRAPDGSCSYTAFELWGPGRTAKVQCDFCALMSPAQFRRFVQPWLQRQCARLDNSMYHLDGPDAIKHLDALMEIPELDAVQWTSGAAKPDGGWDGWYPIYDKVRRADKSLWIALYDGGFEDWTARADRLVARYGADGLYLLFPTMSEREAERLIDHAETVWR